MKNIKKIILPVFVIGLFFSQVMAQTASNYQVFITWQADNFFPSDYQGKAWATPFSPIKASAVLIKDKKNVDLANAEIFWYLDKELISREVGRQTIDFKINKQNGDKHFLMVNIKPEIGGSYESALEIPISEPRLTTTNNFLSNEVPANSQLQNNVIPYFFNIKNLNDLAIKWRVKNQTAEGSQLTINTGSPNSTADKTFFIEITASNKKNLFETVVERLKMNIY